MRTINITQELQIVIYKEQITENGELYVEGGLVNGVTVKQTLGNPNSPANLCFDPITNNFYWERKVIEDVRDGGITINSYNFNGIIKL